MGACHGILSGPAIERINASKFKKVVVTNTLDMSKFKGKTNKIDVIDVSDMCAYAINCSLTGESLSQIMNLHIN